MFYKLKNTKRMKRLLVKEERGSRKRRKSSMKMIKLENAFRIEYVSDAEIFGDRI
jgi:hypothetical protein